MTTTRPEAGPDKQQQRPWNKADTIRVGRMFAAALLLGLVLRLMAVNAPPTNVAAKESPEAQAMSAIGTNEVAKTDGRR